jgi:hypothetical protein
MQRPSMAAWLVLLMSVVAVAQTSQERKAISFAKAIPVSQLDKKLPATPFERWLTIQAGAGAQMTWEVTDCGEQTGTTADSGRDFPMCVEVNAHTRDDREIVVSIAVGSFKQGIQGKPSTWWITVGYDPASDKPLETLSEVPLKISGAPSTPAPTPVRDVPGKPTSK